MISSDFTHTVEYHIYRNSSRTRIIYLTVLIAILLISILLPIIQINISIQGNGVIRPISEKTEVKNLYNGMVDSVYITDNQFVIQGSPLIRLNTHHLDARFQYLDYQKSETKSYINDLFILTLKIDKNSTIFQSLTYKQEYFQYCQHKEELQNRSDKAFKEFQRNKLLFENGVIPEKEYDDYRYQYKSAENELKIYQENQLNKWQSDLSTFKKTLAEIESTISQLNKEKEYYTIKAPVTGTIEQFAGIFSGSQIQAGQTIAVISPDSSLISEIYVNPKDIGYINPSSQVKIQVDAFNYNEWGLISGKVSEISSDFMLINNTPVFKVRCSMDKTWLSLKNNVKGNLKKGMTIRARFLVAKRSLFQLLYEDIDDWINPVQYSYEVNSNTH